MPPHTLGLENEFDGSDDAWANSHVDQTVRRDPSRHQMTTAELWKVDLQWFYAIFSLHSCSSLISFQGYAARVLYSPWFRFYYVAMVSINFFALVFTVLEPLESSGLGWFIALEVFITAMLVFELMLRIVTEGRSVPWSELDSYCAFLSFSESLHHQYDRRADWQQRGPPRQNDRIRHFFFF